MEGRDRLFEGGLPDAGRRSRKSDEWEVDVDRRSRERAAVSSAHRKKRPASLETRWGRRSATSNALDGKSNPRRRRRSGRAPSCRLLRFGLGGRALWRGEMRGSTKQHTMVKAVGSKMSEEGGGKGWKEDGELARTKGEDGCFPAPWIFLLAKEVFSISGSQRSLFLRFCLAQATSSNSQFRSLFLPATSHVSRTPLKTTSTRASLLHSSLSSPRSLLVASSSLSASTLKTTSSSTRFKFPASASR